MVDILYLFRYYKFNRVAALAAAVARIRPFIGAAFGHMFHVAITVDAIFLENDDFFQGNLWQHTRIFEQHAAHHLRAGTDVAAMAYPGRPDDGGARLDLAAGTDIHGPFNLRAFPVDARIQTDPDTVFQLYTRHVHVGYFAHHDALRYFPVILDIADIDPVEGARLRVKGQALFYQQGKQVGADVKHRILRYQVQHGRLENVDAGADMVGQGGFLAGLFLESLDAAILVTDHHAIARYFIPRHLARDHAGQRALAAMLEQGRLDVQIDHRVAAQHDGGVVKKAAELLDLLHAAG